MHYICFPFQADLAELLHRQTLVYTLWTQTRIHKNCSFLCKMSDFFHSVFLKVPSLSPFLIASYPSHTIYSSCICVCKNNMVKSTGWNGKLRSAEMVLTPMTPHVN